MRFSSLLAPISLIGMASALPSLAKRGGGGDEGKCIPYNTAVEIVDQFVSTLTNFDTNVATNLLAPSFTDTSDSINFLAGIPLGSVTFPSPAAYIAGQGTQPPIGLDILNIDAVTCDGVIVFRWQAYVGIQVGPVKGITVLYAVQSGSDCDVVGPTGYQLGKLYSEFNSAVWTLDIGGTCTPPSAPSRLFKV
ncbi:uncharacterized protein Z518_02862 [Rhinocladiella mackenziei CBS 650.93]|uniref:NTF2-like domain-containing protein n=1 Tax=Rhinocladiella mackenziei CBS 650.93 TaxID=1442369 RepID=A0A0D2IXU5_9EURO|nr:uncharacterized protein Z518_02862 [Rhinocladiella mackenziei CBS 650.93]KIX08206.1 hypothetical protein Z518_02862 [Rhinocladiella mackenziei CBS 650.93]